MSDSYVGKVQGTPALTSGQMNHLNLDSTGNLLVNVAQGSFSTTTGAQYNATPPTLSSGQTGPLQCDQNGKMLIAGTINATSAATYNSAAQSFANGTSNPLQADSKGALLVNNGASLSTPLRIDPVGTTTQPISGSVSVSPTTTGGLATAKLISAASTNATVVKASAGQVYNVQAFNVAASARFLKLYNKATAPTVGTDTPIATWLVPANGSGFVIEISSGLACSAGIAFALTGGMADTDATAIAASDVVVNFQFK